MVNTPILITVN